MRIEYIILLSYISGSIPFGYLLTKFFLNKDVRKIGSGNIGATNVLRTGSKMIGFSTLILDISKAIIPIILIKIYFVEYLFLRSEPYFNEYLFSCVFILSKISKSTLETLN